MSKNKKSKPKPPTEIVKVQPLTVDFHVRDIFHALPPNPTVGSKVARQMDRSRALHNDADALERRGFRAAAEAYYLESLVCVQRAEQLRQLSV